MVQQSNRNIYTVNATEFTRIPGNPIAYWVNENMICIFENSPTIESISKPRQGLATGNNDAYLREWFEVNSKTISFDSDSLDSFFSTGKTYIPYNKGGTYKKWYGNLEFVIKFSSEYYRKLGQVGNHLPSRDLYFKESITWSKVTSGGLSLRYNPKGSAFDVAGCSIFASESILMYLLALCNSNIMQSLIRVLSQTLNYEVGTIKSMPVKVSAKDKRYVNDLSASSIEFAKEDWDAYELSWDFKKHPLL